MTERSLNVGRYGAKLIWEAVMVVEKEETVVVERSGSIGGIIAAIALLIAVLGVLKYFGMLPF